MKMLSIFLAAFFSVASFGYAVCPDGSRLEEGNYCVRSPDGSYMKGYLGESIQMTRCPDGSYVSGRQCIRQWDGTYVGE